LGWAFPASLGVKCALPNRPVLCFTGNGGFYYHISELETAARFGINIVVLVNNNHSLGQEQRLQCGLRRHAARAGARNVDV